MSNDTFPGPWRWDRDEWDEDTEAARLVADNGNAIIEPTENEDGTGLFCRVAHQRLIASAWLLPELVEAFDDLLSVSDPGIAAYRDGNAVLQRAREALGE